MTVSRGMKKEISQEIGDLLVDVARLADRLETDGKLGEHADGFREWWGTVENQVDTLNGLTKEISRMFQTSEDNPLKAVKILSPRFDKG